MNLMILAYFSGRWPWLMPYYFSVKFPILMAIRTYTFVKQDWGYFMLDWCGCSPPLPGPLPRYHGCHPQVSPLKTSDLEPPNRRQTPAGPTCRAGVTLPTSCCLPSCGRRCATTQTFSRPCFASRTARSPGRYASVSARAAVLRQLQLADWSFVPRHCCDAACLVEAAVTCFASSFLIIKKKADEKLRHNTNTAEQSKRVRRQVLLFRNSLVFHSLERITSCFIHISPM